MASKQSVAARSAQKAARDALEDDVIEWARMPLDGRVSAFLDPNVKKRIPEYDRHMGLGFNLSQVPDPTTEEAEKGATHWQPSTAELEAAAFAMGFSVSLRNLATELKHGLLGQEDAGKATRFVRAVARLFNIPWDAPPRAHRDMIMDLVEFQVEGAVSVETIRHMPPDVRIRYLSGLTLGALSGICVHIPGLATAAQQPEVLRAMVAVIRARAGVRDGGPGIDTALQCLFKVLGVPLSKNSVRQARMDWKRKRRDGEPRRRKRPDPPKG